MEHSTRALRLTYLPERWHPDSRRVVLIIASMPVHGGSGMALTAAGVPGAAEFTGGAKFCYPVTVVTTTLSQQVSDSLWTTGLLRTDHVSNLKFQREQVSILRPDSPATQAGSLAQRQCACALARALHCQVPVPVPVASLPVHGRWRAAAGPKPPKFAATANHCTACNCQSRL